MARNTKATVNIIPLLQLQPNQHSSGQQTKDQACMQSKENEVTDTSDHLLSEK